jgi:hypothetical protein
MQLLKFELVNSPTWVIARSVCAIHTISIHTKSNCSPCFTRKEVYIRDKI